MEPDIQKTIQRKVYAAEMRPTRWQKEKVWERMGMKTKTRSRKPIYFSIAASLVVALLAVKYIYLGYTISAASQEKALTKETSKPAVQSIDEKPVVSHLKMEPIAPAKINTSKNYKSVESKLPDASPVKNQDSASIYFTEVPAVASVDFIVYDVNAPVATENGSPRVKVIIGIIPQQEQPVVATRKEKKSKFRFFNSEKEKFPDNANGESKLIIARIN
ncbi:hypothetical protein [Ohtaekwangia koreensis]|uniref:Uncharacterized protein n=1 Tax=Ohtaekwangia koreensis TaxID=688867 RepID=A0A1T5LSH5_9BACT|nr:hypothetical protein [Ohtaekwangia koreensis]SKC78834.1 hypothetical protein SAMN05660236_3819 [Ohtaekwangia koreensis]